MPFECAFLFLARALLICYMCIGMSGIVCSVAQCMNYACIVDVYTTHIERHTVNADNKSIEHSEMCSPICAERVRTRRSADKREEKERETDGKRKRERERAKMRERERENEYERGSEV